MPGRARGVSRRTFLGAAAGALAAPMVSAQRSRPNILMITCDQMRGDALGSMRNRNAITPHLDLLALRGTQFTRCFSNSPVCVPSRITAMTGRKPHEHGSLNNDDALLDSLSNTLAGAVQDAGYYTGWIGKDHCFERGVLDEFDVFSERRREPFRKYESAVPPWWHGNMHWQNDDCFAAVNTAEALSFMKGAPTDQPFFLHVSYFDPHPPYFAPASATAKYMAERLDVPNFARPELLSPRLADYARALHFDKMSEEELRETMRHYYASIEWGVDYQVGRLMAGLRGQGVADNTLVIFTSDHGDFMGEYGMVRKAMFLYDALLHIPCIIRGPGVNRQVSEALAQGADIFPTIADLAGLDLPDGVSGKSLGPICRGETEQVHDYITASATYSDLPADYFDDPEPLYGSGIDTPLHKRVAPDTWSGRYRTAALRTKRWKFILNETHDPELYYYDNDGLSETRNAYRNQSANAPTEEWTEQLIAEGAWK